MLLFSKNHIIKFVSFSDEMIEALVCKFQCRYPNEVVEMKFKNIAQRMPEVDLNGMNGNVRKNISTIKILSGS